MNQKRVIQLKINQTWW